jgi:hypothetical protein
MHVPKTAGTSVLASLEQALPLGTISPKREDPSMVCCGFRDYDRLNPQVREVFVVGDDEVAALSDYSVVSGHFSLPTLLRVTRASAVATVLREPRARVLSQYAFWRLFSPTVRTAWSPIKSFDHALRPLDEFLTEPLVAAATDNLVCRMLLGDDSRIPRVGFVADSDIDAVALDAIGALETLGYVGVLELGDSIWDGLSGFFGVPLEPISVNKTESHRETADAPPAGGTVTLETLDALDARTAADAIVYRNVLSTNGYSAGYIERLQASAFASELIQLGNVVGTSATEARVRGRRSEDLARQLLTKDEELAQASALVHETREQLAETNEQLGWHRLWLEAIQGSASWRLTAPLRAGKRTLRRLSPSAGGVATRANSEH